MMFRTSPPFWRNTSRGLNVTSWTYPVEVVEELNVGVSLSTGSYIIQQPSDELNVSFAILGGSLISSLRSHAQPHEDSVDVGLLVMSGALVNTLQSHVQPHEDSVDVGLSIFSGSLQEGLVSTTMDTDSVNVGFSLISGSLV